jgi:hypothetical protein
MVQLQILIEAYRLEADCGALSHSIGNEMSLLWGRLPATIPSRQGAAPAGIRSTLLEAEK